MDIGSISLVAFFASLMVASTPILLAALGEMITERAGVLNLGVEGMMIIGAICGFAIAVESGSATVGFLGAAIVVDAFCNFDPISIRDTSTKRLGLDACGRGARIIHRPTLCWGKPSSCWQNAYSSVGKHSIFWPRSVST